MSSVSFEKDKKYYESIPRESRSAFLLEVLSTAQLEGAGQTFLEQYPYQNDLQYQQYNLHYYHTQINQSPQAIFFFLHGFNSYGGNSGYIANRLVQNIPNVNFFSIDFINFGQSTGDSRGYIHSFQQILNQANTFMSHIMEKFSNSPKVYLVGESFGGAIGFKLTLLSPVKYSGIIFLNPALRQIKQSKFYMKKLGKIIGYFFPKLKLTSQCHRNGTKYNLQEIIVANPYLYNDRNIPGSVRVVLNAIEQIQRSYKLLETPYIVIQGGVDKLVDLFAPLDLEKESPCKDKTTVYIKSMWHSLFYEEEILNVTEIIVDWISKRI